MASRRSPGSGTVRPYMTKAGQRWFWKATIPLADGTRRQVMRRGFLTKTAAMKAMAATIAAHAPAPRSDGFSIEQVLHIDPAGFYVYLLWASRGDEVPIYVGSSGNILARLGDHLGDMVKRSQIGWITLIRFPTEKAMLKREGQLIRRYRPMLNRHIPVEVSEPVAQPGKMKLISL